MAKYRLLVFDLDGTLIDSKNDLAAAVNYVRAWNGRTPIDVDIVRSYVGNGVSTLLQRALPEMSETDLSEARAKFNEFYAAHLLDTTDLYPGIRELLLSYSGNKTMAVLTNKPVEYARAILKDLGIAHYFEIIWGGDSGAKRKPDAEPLLKIMEQLGAGRRETMMIGDGINDIIAARSAGIVCMAVGYGYTASTELNNLKPDYFCDDPEAIGEVVARADHAVR